MLGPTGGRSVERRGGQGADPGQTQLGKEAAQLILHLIRHGAHQQQTLVLTVGQQGRQGRQGIVFTLGEGSFNAAAGIAHHPHPGQVALTQALGSIGQVQLDHLGGTGAHQEEGANLRPPLQELFHHPIQLIVGVRQACQVPFPQDGGAKAGLREDHDPRRRLDQVGAGAGAHHQEEGIRHAAMEPDNAGKTTKHLPLAPFPQQRQRLSTSLGGLGSSIRLLDQGHRQVEGGGIQVKHGFGEV